MWCDRMKPAIARGHRHAHSRNLGETELLGGVMKPKAHAQDAVRSCKGLEHLYIEVRSC